MSWGVGNFQRKVMATHPVRFNCFHICFIPILVHSINIYSFHSILISDLNVWATRKGAVPPSNMDTTCFHSLENISFEPLQWLGLYYYLVDLCHNVCFSLWDTSLLWKLHFYWIQDIFIKRQHVHLSCLSWSRSTCWSYVIFLGTVNHDILGPLQSISLQTVSRKLIFFWVMASSSWWTLVCMSLE